MRIKRKLSTIIDDVYQFQLSEIPKDTKLVHAVNYKKIIGESEDVDLKSPDLFRTMEALAWKMVKTCVGDGGIGLAAPQLGIRKKALIMIGFKDPYIWEFNRSFSLVLNPTFKPVEGTETRWDSESCLSVPGQSYLISRPQEINVSYWSFDKKKNLKNYMDKIEGHQARLFLHERDHLYGTNIAELHARQTKGKRKRRKDKRR